MEGDSILNIEEKYSWLKCTKEWEEIASTI